jgi:hypothetical protein
MFTSLARCSRVNACRKLDQGGQAKGPVAARFLTSSRQRGSAGSGPAGRRHFGSGSGGGGAPFVERSLAPNDRMRESGCVAGGATGSVSDLTVRLTQRKRTPTRGLTPPETKRRRPSGDGQRTVTAGVRGTNRHVTRGRGCLRATAFGWCPKGYSASPRRFTVQTPARACWAKGSDHRGGQADASRSLASGWIPWVLVDNKSVAEIGEKHLVWRGSRSLRREWHAVHEHDSASHHRDGREAGACSKGARAVRSLTNQFMTRRHPGLGRDQSNRRRPGSRNREL